MSIIISIVLILVGVVLIGYFYPKTKNNIKEMNSIETIKISELKEILSGATNEFRKYVELKGKVSDENLMEAPYSKKQVAYYEYQVYRVYERRNEDNTTDRQEDLVSSEKSEQDFSMIDESSEDPVLLEVSKKCKIDIPTTYDKFEPRGSSFSLGGIIISQGGDDSRTLGYNIKEKSIEANQDLYVIGEAYKDGDKICIGKPQDGKKPFIVTTKSEEQLIKSSKINSIIQLVAGIAVILVGIFVLTMK